MWRDWSMCVLEDSVLSRDIVNLNYILIYEAPNVNFPPCFFIIELEKTLLLDAKCALCTMLGAQRYLPTNKRCTNNARCKMSWFLKWNSTFSSFDHFSL